jgi:hypothetical protein
MAQFRVCQYAKYGIFYMRAAMDVGYSYKCKYTCSQVIEAGVREIK